MSAKRKATGGAIAAAVVALMVTAGNKAVDIAGQYFEAKFAATDKSVKDNSEEILAMLDNAIERIDDLERQIKELKR